MKLKKVILFQVGARDKYVFARLFTQTKQLTLFFTDYWISPNSIVSLFFGKKGQRRFNNHLSKVVSYDFWKFLMTLGRKKLFKKDVFSDWIFHDRTFTNHVVRKLKKTKLLYSNHIFWGYTNACLEVFIELEKANPTAFRIMNQIDPGIEYYNILHQLWLDNPKVEDKPLLLPEFFKNRILNEWDLAHLIIVNSEYAKSCLVKHGVKEGKIVFVPLPYEKPPQLELKPTNLDRPLRVGFVGNLNLIKGFDLFLEAAISLSGQMKFLAAGSSWLNPEYAIRASTFIDIRGHLNKDAMMSFYNEIDVLCFPSYSDGFGLVQLEAMSFGIPVLASKNCGNVVIDGVNGFIINHNSSDIISKLKILENRSLLKQMSSNALKRVDDFSMGMLDKRLTEVMTKIETPLKE